MAKARREMFEEQLRALQDDIASLSIKFSNKSHHHGSSEQKALSPARKLKKKGNV